MGGKDNLAEVGSLESRLASQNVMMVIVDVDWFRSLYVVVYRSRQRYNSEPGDTQSSYEGTHSNAVTLLDDSAVVTVARV